MSPKRWRAGVRADVGAIVGWAPRPIEDSIEDCARSLLA